MKIEIFYRIYEQKCFEIYSLKIFTGLKKSLIGPSFADGFVRLCINEIKTLFLKSKLNSKIRIESQNLLIRIMKEWERLIHWKYGDNNYHKEMCYFINFVSNLRFLRKSTTSPNRPILLLLELILKDILKWRRKGYKECVVFVSSFPI